MHSLARAKTPHPTHVGHAGIGISIELWALSSRLDDTFWMNDLHESALLTVLRRHLWNLLRDFVVVERI